MMKQSLFNQLKKNNIIDQLKERNITEYNGKDIHETPYRELVHALTMSKLTEKNIESPENEWF